MPTQKSKSDDYNYITAVGLGNKFSGKQVQMQTALNMQKEDSTILGKGMDDYYASKQKNGKDKVIRMIDINKEYFDKNPTALEEVVLCYRDVLGHKWSKEQGVERSEGGEYLICKQCAKGVSIEDVFPNSETKSLGELDEGEVIQTHKCRHCGGELTFWHDSKTVREMIDLFLNEEVNQKVEDIFGSLPKEVRPKIYKYTHGILMIERVANKPSGRVIGFALGVVMPRDRLIGELQSYVRIKTKGLRRDKSDFVLQFEQELEKLNIIGAYLKLKKRLIERASQSGKAVQKQEAVSEMEAALKQMKAADGPQDISAMQKAVADMEVAIKQSEEKKEQKPDEIEPVKPEDINEGLMYMPELIIRRDEQSSERIKVLTQRFLTAFITRLKSPKINLTCRDVLHWTQGNSSTSNKLIGLDGEIFYEFGYGDLVAVWNDIDVTLEALKKPNLQFWRDIRLRTKQRMAESLKT